MCQEAKPADRQPVLLLLLVAVSISTSVAANSPPAQPTITEPSQDGRVLNPTDVHMETAPFSDPDPGDTHVCTDWEIWAVSPAERVWVSACIGGLEKLHNHLGDGVFENSHAGRAELLFDTDYRLRARHRDSSGDPATEWSPWAERTFRTSSPPQPLPGASGWVPRQLGYRVEVVATNFQLPVNIAFAPNPGDHPDDTFYYVTELYETIKVVTRGGTVRDYATNLLNYDPGGVFPGTGEQGLTGIVVDPATGDLFAAMLYQDTNSPANPKPNYPKVVRFQSNDGGRTAATQTTILDMAGEQQGQSHQISNLSIGPDGKLYVHMGDGFTAATAQNLNSFRGKILRLNFDGTPPPDNPFYDAADGISARDYVYAYGFRNPFGGDWRAADGFHYEVENGGAVDRFARIVPGRNYLWNGSDSSLTNYALYLWSPASAPVNLVFVESNRFGGSGFPPEKWGRAFVTESGSTYATGPATRGKRITEFVLDAGGNLVSGPTKLVEYNGPGKSTAVALAAGPDGLYFTDFYKEQNATSPIQRGANILRVRFAGLPAPGAGEGLRGEYYDSSDLTNLRLVQTNATVDFNWGSGSPDPSIAPDTFSVRWTGQVQPFFTETYTFHTLTDDGVRLWVDGQLLVDSWANQSATERGGSLALTAYRHYDIKMEYYENTGSAQAQLLWSSPSTPKTIIPQTQLYPGTNAPALLRFQSIERLTNAVRLGLGGEPGDVQGIETSTNLVHWTALATLTNITGLLSFVDLLTNGSPQRFYRGIVSPPLPPAEIIVDNSAATIVGSWSTGITAVDKYGTNYQFRTPATGAAYLQFTPDLPVAGSYQVYEWHSQGSNRTTNAPVVITFNGGVQTNRLNQQIGGGQWVLLGTFNFAAGTSGHVRVVDSFADTSRVVIADAVRFVYLGPGL